MTRPRPMQPVLLDDEAHEPTASAPPDGGGRALGGGAPPRRWRTARLRWLAAALVVVVGLVGAQQVLDSREQQRLDRLRALPGVLDAVDPALLGDLWSMESSGSSTRISVPDGLLEGMVGSDGAQAVRLLDGGTGAEVWSTPLAAVDPHVSNAVAAIGYWQSPVCQTVPDGSLVWCVVSDEYPAFTPDFREWPTPGRTRIVAVDATTGEVVAERATAPGGSTAALGDNLVTCAEADDGAVALQAWDPRADRTAWQSTLPTPPGAQDHEQQPVRTPARAPVACATADDMLAVMDPSHVWLVSEDGQVRRTLSALGPEAWIDRLRGGLWTAVDYSSGSPMTSLLRADGTWGEPVGEQPVLLSVDDGSAPGLCFTSGGGQIRAIDCATTAQRWAQQSFGGASGLLIDGTLYLSTSVDVLAVDAASGEAKWHAQRDATVSMSADEVITDGHQLLMLEEAPSTAGDAADVERLELVALSMADGSESWRTPLESSPSRYGWHSMSELGGRLAITSTENDHFSSTTRVYGHR
ncbi:outer membrane protein assembly factor BamB family protein [Cellulomonas chengniuliangii]|uniref:outer membrane protein assembly factor BamB family protein n=1 Tax=Cellulomonas chengniuliangii TaxID=2968084 RepID=UPI001D0EF08D|nr:PQQ-binding-like beta-propeller repeat protein [Cellulomonas chengniuliangii]MCC2317781.1 PQQ-like beta-propeller repeat protein [Cellulomonas chengniuliangii]